jgi:hypothetical protein
MIHCLNWIHIGYKDISRLHLSTSFVPTPSLGLVVSVTILMCDSDMN